ncbi:MAG TPA: amidohydrolase family protein, partial [Beijerinckiaceae bacterium]|nr:amidohydrolase family protein [Beijerinckiaceae bacterium]
MKKIALEEHFLSPGLIEYWQPTMKDVPREGYERIFTALTDFGEKRLRAMDEAGIDEAVLSISGPGVQIEADAAKATARAAQSNDFLAAAVATNPRRYFGFAHLALQNPEAAARELERCVKELGFKGAMINGHTNGHYLDEPQFDPFWAKTEELQVPVYLHPADPLLQ